MVSYKHPGLFFSSLSYHGTESFCHADASLCSFVLDDKVGNCLKLRCLRLMGSIERKTIKNHPPTENFNMYFFLIQTIIYRKYKYHVVNLKSVLSYRSCWCDISLHKKTLACYSNAWTFSHTPPHCHPSPGSEPQHTSSTVTDWGHIIENIKYWCVKPECQQVKGQHYSSRAITEEWVSTWRPSA